MCAYTHTHTYIYIYIYMYIYIYLRKSIHTFIPTHGVKLVVMALSEFCFLLGRLTPWQPAIHGKVLGRSERAAVIEDKWHSVSFSRPTVHFLVFQTGSLAATTRLQRCAEMKVSSHIISLEFEGPINKRIKCICRVCSGQRIRVS